MDVAHTRLCVCLCGFLWFYCSEAPLWFPRGHRWTVELNFGKNIYASSVYWSCPPLALKKRGEKNQTFQELSKRKALCLTVKSKVVCQFDSTSVWPIYLKNSSPKKSFTHPHVVSKPHEFLPSVEHKRRYLAQCLCSSFPYNAIMQLMHYFPSLLKLYERNRLKFK